MLRYGPRWMPTASGVPTIPSPSDNGDFHAVAVAGQDDERRQALVKKISEFNFLTGFVQNLMVLKLY